MTLTPADFIWLIITLAVFMICLLLDSNTKHKRLESKLDKIKDQMLQAMEAQAECCKLNDEQVKGVCEGSKLSKKMIESLENRGFIDPQP